MENPGVTGGAIWHKRIKRCKQALSSFISAWTCNIIKEVFFALNSGSFKFFCRIHVSQHLERCIAHFCLRRWLNLGPAQEAREAFLTGRCNLPTIIQCRHLLPLISDNGTCKPVTFDSSRLNATSRSTQVQATFSSHHASLTSNICALLRRWEAPTVCHREVGGGGAHKCELFAPFSWTVTLASNVLVRLLQFQPGRRKCGKRLFARLFSCFTVSCTYGLCWWERTHVISKRINTTAISGHQMRPPVYVHSKSNWG